MDFFDLHCDTITTAMHQSVGFNCDYLDISFPKNEKIQIHYIMRKSVCQPNSKRSKKV